MSRLYRAFVSVYTPTIIDGWGVYRCRVDDAFDLFACATHSFIDGNRTYDFELFVDIVSEVPIYFFGERAKAEEFARIKTNRYPIFRQLQLLKHREEYWFGTWIQAYFDAYEKGKMKDYYDCEV